MFNENLRTIEELGSSHHKAKPVVAKITSNNCWQVVSHVPNPDGYIELHRKQKMTGALKTNGAHRLSFEKFIGPIPKHLSVLHRCDNPACVNPDHLFLGTQLQNMQDAKNKGRLKNQTGQQNGNAKLNDRKVKEIKKLYFDNNEDYKTLATKYGVTTATIGQIIRGVRWTHLTERT